jgi:hypothetical protein
MAESVGRRQSTSAPRLPSYRRRAGTSSRLAAGHRRTNRSTKARRVTGSESKRMSGPHEDHHLWATLTPSRPDCASIRGG